MNPSPADIGEGIEVEIDGFLKRSAVALLPGLVVRRLLIERIDNVPHAPGQAVHPRLRRLC